MRPYSPSLRISSTARVTASFQELISVVRSSEQTAHPTINGGRERGREEGIRTRNVQKKTTELEQPQRARESDWVSEKYDFNNIYEFIKSESQLTLARPVELIKVYESEKWILSLLHIEANLKNKQTTHIQKRILCGKYKQLRIKWTTGQLQPSGNHWKKELRTQKNGIERIDIQTSDRHYKNLRRERRK